MALSRVSSATPPLPNSLRCQSNHIHQSGKKKQRGGKTYICGAHDTANLLHRVEIGAQTTVHGEDLLVNDGSNGKAVEAVGESLPELDVVSALALIVETVDTVDRGTLVVSTQNEEVLGVLDLVGKEKANGLERLLATVDVVTEEKIVGLRRETAVFEETQKVIVLAVDITADLRGRGHVRRGPGSPQRIVRAENGLP